MNTPIKKAHEKKRQQTLEYKVVRSCYPSEIESQMNELARRGFTFVSHSASGGTSHYSTVIMQRILYNL